MALWLHDTPLFDTRFNGMASGVCFLLCHLNSQGTMALETDHYGGFRACLGHVWCLEVGAWSLVYS